MNELIYQNLLFGNTNNQIILCDYTRELVKLKQFINISETYILKKKENNLNYESVCYLFAKSIIDYSKMAFDNFVLGNFNSASMITRCIFENYVCLTLIFKHQDQQLWKYYLAYTFKQTIKINKNPNWKEFNDFCKEFKIGDDFTKKRNGKTAFIDIKYGWTFKIYNDKHFTFQGLCKLANIKYDDFTFMSKYSHGTDYFLKIEGMLSTPHHVGEVISCIYVYLYQLITLYCPEYIDSNFDKLSDEILFYLVKM